MSLEPVSHHEHLKRISQEWFKRAERLPPDVSPHEYLAVFLEEVERQAVLKAFERFDGWLCLDHGGEELEHIRAVLAAALENP